MSALLRLTVIPVLAALAFCTEASCAKLDEAGEARAHGAEVDVDVEREIDEQLAKKIDDAIRVARTGSAFIRPQAIMKLVRFGEPAAQRLLELSKDASSEDLALFGTHLVEAFGQFENTPELRNKLWPLLEDSEFPWRPAAARGLSWAPEVSDGARFASYANDPIAPVRAAILDGLFRVSQVANTTLEVERSNGAEADEIAQLERSAAEANGRFLSAAVDMLDDITDRVRRRAAILLHARGHARGLRWLIEDLKRVDMFFDFPTGLTARYEAQGLLLDLGVEAGEYDPEAPLDSADTVKALASIEAQIEQLIATSDAKLDESARDLVPNQVHPIARATASPIRNAVVGLELRSCRRGDYYLRWTMDDHLVIGDGNAARIKLPAGTTARIAAAAMKTKSAVGDTNFWGRQGCDKEAFLMPRDGSDRGGFTQLIVAKGEEKVADLRPGALTELGKAMADSIPTAADLMQADRRTKQLAERVRAAFKSIGGPVD